MKIRRRVCTRVDTEPLDDGTPETCVVVGCGLPGSPACDEHLRALPSHELVAVMEALEQAVFAPNVQRARSAIRSRVGAILRGVRT
jgi:hypothetical protein